MTKDNSPMYDQGRADAEADEQLIGQCPPQPPLGPRPPYPDWPAMYQAGYDEHFVGVPHICSDRCRSDDER